MHPPFAHRFRYLSFFLLSLLICLQGALPIVAATRESDDRLRHTVFLGDSTTAHLRSRGVLPGGTATTQVWCPKNNTLLLSGEILSLRIVYPETGEEMTIAEAAKRKKPPYLVITLGINGVHTFTEKRYKAFYRRLLDAIQKASPQTEILLQSVYPVSARQSAWKLSADTLNGMIDRMNLWVRELADEYGLRYLDTQSILKDDQNALLSDYDCGDGIHLNAAGYRAVLDYLSTNGYG